MARARRFLTQRGFTLIEILVVIVIIGVLSIMGVSKYTEFTTESRRRACIGNAANVDSTIGVWESQNVAIPRTVASNVQFDTNGVVLVVGGGVANITGVAPAKQIKATSKVIVDYTKDSNVFVCPERANMAGGIDAIHKTAELNFEWLLVPASGDARIGRKLRGTRCTNFGGALDGSGNGPDGTNATLHKP